MLKHILSYIGVWRACVFETIKFGLCCIFSARLHSPELNRFPQHAVACMWEYVQRPDSGETPQLGVNGVCPLLVFGMNFKQF